MRRWLVLALGLALAAVAGHALLTLQRESGSRGGAGEARRVPSPAPHDEIDEASRQRLLEILREEEAP